MTQSLSASFIAVLAVLYGLYRYLRFIHPCLTPFEMDQALKKIEDFNLHTEEADPTTRTEWVDIVNSRRRLQLEASRIRTEAAEGFTYCGFNPRMMPEIARWYKRSEALEREILIVRERDLQKRLKAEAQLYR